MTRVHHETTPRFDDELAEYRIAYVGCTEAGFEVCRRLVAEGVPIAEVVTIPPATAADHGIAGYYDFTEFGLDRDIPVYTPEAFSMDTDADLTHFEDLDADLLIVNGWQRLIPGEILSTLSVGALGVHGSAFGLPKGRGRSPMNWSLIEDLDRFLLSVIKLDEHVDAGLVVDTCKYDITPHDDIRTLYHKLTIATQEILLDHLPAILAGEFEYEPQEGTPTYYPKRRPEDGAIHWEDTTATIHNLTRAVARPYPGAFTEYEGEQIMVWEAIPFSDDFLFDAPPGTVVQVFEATGEFVVTAADGTLLVRDWDAEAWTPERGQQLASLDNDSLDSPDRVDSPGHEANLS
jgi:UDP-4-amino-4-deoxy-L-arabinose formyltransferase/UDP-glucuronic acid dehydrogenase (UDP-4-keto-hexauronic acid decarboxylating)